MKKLVFFAAIVVAFATVSCGGSNDENKTPEEGKIENKKEKTGETVKEEKIVPKKKTDEEKIKDIKEMYSEIESNSASYSVKKVHYANPAPEMYYDHSDYTAYYKADELVKLVENGGEEMYLFTTTYYMNKGELFFIYNTGSADDIPYIQNRYYLDGDRIMKALTKQKEEMQELPKMQDLKNAPNPNFVKDAAKVTANQLKFYKEALERYATSK